MGRLLISFCGCLLTFSTFGVSAEPDFKIELRRPQDKFTATTVNKQIAYLITSPSGIGQVKLTRKTGVWPREAILRFQYEPTRSFRSMEGFSVRTERLDIRGAIRPRREQDVTPGLESQLEFWFVPLAGHIQPSGPQAMPAAGTISAPVKIVDNTLEVHLPADLLGDSREVTIGWVDAYRN